MFYRLGKIVVLAAVAAVMIAGSVFAQPEDKKKKLEVGKWYPKLDFGLVLAQSAYSDNWNGSEQGQIAWTFILNSGLENQFRPKLNWLNTLKLAFGHTHNQKFSDTDPGVRVWDKPEKTSDLIDFESLLRVTLDTWVDPYVALRFLSQFLDNSDPKDRDLWLSPATLFGSAGIARQFYRTEEEFFISRLGFAGRENMRQFYDANDQKQFERSHDGGIEWVTDYRMRVLENKVVWTSKLTVYQPLEYSYHGDFDGINPDTLAAYGINSDVSDYPLAVDVEWENIFSADIVSWLGVNFYLLFRYDKYDNSVIPKTDGSGDLLNPYDVQAAVREAGQFKQILGISITYKFL